MCVCVYLAFNTPPTHTHTHRGGWDGGYFTLCSSQHPHHPAPSVPFLAGEIQFFASPNLDTEDDNFLRTHGLLLGELTSLCVVNSETLTRFAFVVCSEVLKRKRTKHEQLRDNLAAIRSDIEICRADTDRTQRDIQLSLHDRSRYFRTSLRICRHCSKTFFNEKI